MKTIENWAVITSKNCSEFTTKCLILMGLHKPGNAGRYNHLTILKPGATMIGYTYEGNDRLNGQFVQTSPIVACDDNSVTTASGTIYKLGKKHPDYIRFENALLKDYPIIRDWSIGFLYDDQWTPYYMEGTIYHWHTKKHIASEIASQNIDEGTVTFKDGTIAFVDYLAMSSKQKKLLNSDSTSLELKPFCGISCVPTFSEVKWYCYGTGVARHRDQLTSGYYMVYSH